MLKKIIAAVFSVYIFAVLSVNIFAQGSTAGWNIYTSFREVRGVIHGQNNITWAASTGGLFSFESGSLTITNKFTTLDGLLSNELTSVTVSNDGRVWSGGFDGSVSVYNPSEGTWKVITDIKTSTEPSKRINAFYQYNNFMFIATEFSIIKFSVPQFQFVDQPYIFLGLLLPIKTAVNDLLVVNDTIWAATKSGIAYANINSSLPIQSSWKNFVSSNSVVRSNNINSVTYFNNKAVFGTDSGMVYFENGALNVFDPLYNGQSINDVVYRMTVSGNDLYFSTFTLTGLSKTNFRVFKVNQSNINNAELVSSGIEVNALDINSSGELMIGTVNNGVDVHRNNTSNYVSPNGPASNVFQDVTVDLNGNVWGVSGGLNAGIYRFDLTNWKNFNTTSHPWMGGNDFRHIYSSKFSGTVWAGGFGNGLLKFEGDTVFQFSNHNSCLIPYDGNFTLVEGMGEDNTGNFWLINRASPIPIVRFSPLPCVGFTVPTNASSTTMIAMAVDNFNTKWMNFPQDLPNGVRGIVYFNENTNPTGSIINAQNLGSNISTANHIVADNNGEIWVGTDNGISIIRDPSQVINNPGSIPSTEKMRIIENGISTPLTENVQFIAVDALNNKWIGTLSNGLLYVSPDGSTLLARYNTRNSPLPDNKILSIVISRQSGVAYFGTEKGLASFNTIAVQPLEECDKISAGPNPFTVPNDNKLKIDGLVAESTVKILSISGTLVAEFETPGGRIVEWDGRDINGNFVSSGIYIIAGFNKDASKVCTGKVAVVRR